MSQESNMASTDRLAVILIPDDPQGLSLFKAAKSWFDAGILGDFFMLRTQEALVEKLEALEAPCFTLSAPDTTFNLFEYLGDVELDRIDIIAPWILGTKAANENLANLGLTLTKKIKSIFSTPLTNTVKDSRKVFSVLLSIPTMGESLKLKKSRFNYSLYDLNLYISPELRALPWAGATPLKSGDGFEMFAVAQIATAAGAWSNAINPVSKVLQDRDFRFGEGNVVIARFLISAVVAKGIASKMVVSALQNLQDPDFDVYQISDVEDRSRPVKITSDNVSLIEQSMNDRVTEIIQGANGDLTFSYQEGSIAADEKVTWRQALQEQWEFSVHAVRGFYPYSTRWVKNQWAKLVERLIPRRKNQIREPEPEIWLGIDAELNAKVTEILSFYADEATQQARAEKAANLSISFQPELWKQIREISIGAVDGHKFEYKKEQVLPHVRYVAADPNARFLLKPDVLNIIGSDFGEVSVAESESLRSKLLGKNDELESELSQLKARLVELQNLAEEPELEDPAAGFDDYEVNEEFESEDGEEYEEDSDDEDGIAVELLAVGDQADQKDLNQFSSETRSVQAGDAESSSGGQANSGTNLAPLNKGNVFEAHDLEEPEAPLSAKSKKNVEARKSSARKSEDLK